MNSKHKRWLSSRRPSTTLADWDRQGLHLAGRIRNQRVAERCDRMVAFWDGWSTCTQDAFTRALELGKHVVLYRLRSIALVGALAAAPP